MLRITDSRRSQPSRDVRRSGNSASERGQALVETAIAVPLVLLLSVLIFEFGRAYQVAQVLTNAAREGARVAILPNATAADVQSRVTTYLQAGQIGGSASAIIGVNQKATVVVGVSTASASIVTVTYPFKFMVLNPVVNLVVRGSTLGAPINLTASAEMRNEAQ